MSLRREAPWVRPYLKHLLRGGRLAPSPPPGVFDELGEDNAVFNRIYAQMVAEINQLVAHLRTSIDLYTGLPPGHARNMLAAQIMRDFRPLRRAERQLRNFFPDAPPPLHIG